MICFRDVEHTREGSDAPRLGQSADSSVLIRRLDSAERAFESQIGWLSRALESKPWISGLTEPRSGFNLPVSRLIFPEVGHAAAARVSVRI